MNKKELYEENRKLKQILKSYSKFWETDAIEDCSNENRIMKKALKIATMVFLIFGAFLIGLAW